MEDDQYVNKKIEGQIKGTRNPKRLNKEMAFTFQMGIKTINHGLSSSVAFVLFYVLVDEGIVYYLPIQDYFIAHPELFERLENNGLKLNVHIPLDNIVSDDDFELKQIAKSVYVDGPSRQLRKI